MAFTMRGGVVTKGGQALGTLQSMQGNYDLGWLEDLKVLEVSGCAKV